MKQDLERVIVLPSGVHASHQGKEVSIKGNGKEVKKSFDLGKIRVAVEADKIILSAKGATRRESKNLGSIDAHIKNMLAGIAHDFVYNLEICNVHFPMTVKVDGNRFVIKTFLGEKVDRVAQIIPNVKVEVKGSQVTVSSPDVESAGQTAANIERATKVRNRDRRVFQDGIFITSKPE